MGLTASIARVLKLVEDTTGLPVHVEEDRSLPPNILAKVTMARGGVPFHQISYQSLPGQSPDYLIVYQCGFILRRNAVPAPDRVDFVHTEEGKEIVRKWVERNPKNPNPPRENAEGLTGFLHSGLLTQLRSIPVGLRVDSWIRDEFPELHELQKQALARQLNDNASVFRPQVQAMIPSEALNTNAAMSAAFALFWSQTLQQKQIVLPYQAGGYVDKGNELLDIWNSIPSAPSEDIRLIDRWADHLGMKPWFRWKPATG